jgi:ubiquitin-protein ligase
MRRIETELKAILESQDQHPGYTVTPDPADKLVWYVTLIGPADSLYEGGKFKVSVKFPDNYPFKMPVFKFETRIWHPNVIREIILYLNIKKKKNFFSIHQYSFI